MCSCCKNAKIRITSSSERKKGGREIAGQEQLDRERKRGRDI
jgi:hypothetical protein